METPLAQTQQLTDVFKCNECLVQRCPSNVITEVVKKFTLLRNPGNYHVHKKNRHCLTCSNIYAHYFFPRYILILSYAMVSQMASTLSA